MERRRSVKAPEQFICPDCRRFVVRRPYPLADVQTQQIEQL